jgi:hypothetical protein
MNSKLKSQNSTTESQTVFSVKLSSALKDDWNSAFANVTRTKWLAPDQKVVHFVRLDLKLFRGEGVKPITISLTPCQFDWVIHCMENAPSSVVVAGERPDKFICYEVTEKCYGSTFVSIIERRAKFGIELNGLEGGQLEASHRSLAFVLKFQNAFGERLQNLIKYIYSGCLMKIMIKDIRNDCVGCRDESLIESKHICKNITSETVESYFERIWLKRSTIENDFSNLFCHFMKLLNVSDLNRTQAEDLMIVLVKEQKKELLIAVEEIVIGKNRKSDGLAVLDLIDAKKQEDCEIDLSDDSTTSLMIDPADEINEPSAKKNKI